MRVGFRQKGVNVGRCAPPACTSAARFGTSFEAFCVAAAGSLSSSAFVLPILKEKGWEERPEGVAALSILLLQDLAVAPLLVLLPLAAGGAGGAWDAVGQREALEWLAFKATIGFGGVLALGNFVLKYAFDLVAAAKSTETFVAATLLVAVGNAVWMLTVPHHC